MKNILAGALTALALLGSPSFAHADGIQPIEGRSIDLGTFSGIAYYTVESDGLHVVATLDDSRGGTPVRFEATLAPGQRVVLSTPGGQGWAAHTIEITRQDRQVFVQSVALTN